MGKVRARKEVKKKSLKSSGGYNEAQLKSTVGKLESDISAISLGPPRSKILKKSSSSASQLSSNFASRTNVLNKQKKKVRFCQNIVAEELNEQKTSSEDAKHYFKVIHPSAIQKRICRSDTTTTAAKNVHGALGGRINANKPLDSIIPDSEVLKSASVRQLRNFIKNSTKNKKTIQRAKKETFRKKMELLKQKEKDDLKAKQRQQTVIVGDMEPMLQALPALTSSSEDEIETDLMAGKALEEKSKVMPNKTKYSVKKTNQAILDSLKIFEASGVAAGVGIPKT